MNMGQDRHMQMIGGNGGNQFRKYVRQNVGNYNGLIVVLGITNRNGNGNVVAARAEGNANGNNGNQIRCYNYRGLGHLARNCTVRPRRKDAAYLQTQLLIAQKEEVGIQLQAEEFDLMAAAADLNEIKEVNANCILMVNLQQASTSGTQSDKAPVYDLDGSAEYTELLEPILEPHQVLQNDSNVTSVVSSVEQGGGTVEQHPILHVEFISKIVLNSRLKVSRLQHFKISRFVNSPPIFIDILYFQGDRYAVSIDDHGIRRKEEHQREGRSNKSTYDTAYQGIGYALLEFLGVDHTRPAIKDKLIGRHGEYILYRFYILIELDIMLLYDVSEYQKNCVTISCTRYSIRGITVMARLFSLTVPVIKQCLTKKINALHLSSGKQITTLNEEISNLSKQLSTEKSTVSSLLEEKKKLKSDFKIREDELLDKQIQLENKIKELDNILVKTGQSIQTMHMLSPKPDSFYHTEQKMALGYQNPFYLKQAQRKQQSLYNGKVLLEKHDPPVVHDSEETLQLAQESRQKMKQLNKEIKPANYTKINHLSGIFVSQTAKSQEEVYFVNTSKTATVSKSISKPNEEFLDDTTLSVARKFLNEVKSTIVTLQRVVKHRMTLDTHNWSSSAHQEIHKILKEEIFPIINQVDSRLQNFEIQFLKEAAKFVRDFKSLAKEADEYLVKHKALELEIERLLRAIVSQDIMSIVKNNSVVDTSNLQTELERTKERFENCIIKKENEYAKLWNDWLQAQLEDQKGKSKDTPCVSNTLDPLPQKLENKNVELEFRVQNYEKENDHLKTAYKNLFDSINVTRAQTKMIIDSLQNKLHDMIYENAKLRAQLFDKISEQKDTTKGTSMNIKFANQSTERKPFLQPLRNKFVVRQPNASQSERPNFSKTRVPQKVDKMNDLSNPVTSNSVPTTKESKVVENDKVIAPGMFRINPFKNSREEKFVPNKPTKASVRTNLITVPQPHVITKKAANSDSNGFSSTGVDITTKTIRPQPRSNTKNDRVPSASKSSHIKNKEVKVEDHPRNLLLSKNKKHMSSECNNIKLAIWNAKSEIICAMCKQCLIIVNHDACVLNYVNDMNSCSKKQKANKFLGTIRFGNDHVDVILGFGDLQWGNILITSVYFVEGLGHNLFSVGQFCDSDLEVAFRRNTCFVRNLEGADLLKGNLMVMASTFILPQLRHRKSQRASHPPKPVPNSKQRLHLLHMDLCGLMIIASINGKRYVLVIVDDYSRYTWVIFLRSKDEAPEEIKTFLKKITVLLQAPVIIVRTDNDTKFKNQVLQDHFNSVGISCHTPTKVET
ncbi:retrovirus-related pol polyprotein from transposon TNT 1-94 [Tanacetum coccineum]|uniref:Retrovirus-related pol polyprotein from transposon TNT 1-94 n=1 Tax=Tanacetum coccineum TaxID=301880 RepID=A0ABQ4YKB6_9ASTR